MLLMEQSELSESSCPRLFTSDSHRDSGKEKKRNWIHCMFEIKDSPREGNWAWEGMLFLPTSNSSLAHSVRFALIYWTDCFYTATTHGHKANLVPHSDSRDLTSDKLASQNLKNDASKVFPMLTKALENLFYISYNYMKLNLPLIDKH